MTAVRCGKNAAYTLMEMVVAVAVSVVVFGILITLIVGVQRSMVATDQFEQSTNNGNRVADYVGRDLREALAVGTLVNGTYTKLSSFANPVTVDENTVLAINIPDYYTSNVPDNTKGSTYKTTRYPRATLNTSSTYNGNTGAAVVLNGVVPWLQAVTTVTNAVGATTTTAFNSTGTGQIQVRYFRGKRSATDATTCFFRQEYPSNSNTPNSAAVEIAEQVVNSVSTTSLIIIDPDYGTSGDNGTHFRLQSNFTSRFRFIANVPSNNQFVDVYLRNPRRD